MSRFQVEEQLGAHVSTQGGVQSAPGRGVAIGATAVQIFTKTPNQWRDPSITPEARDAFRTGWAASGIRTIVVHDSYLINLASPDGTLSARSVESFIAELQRCTYLGISAIVSHPGNYIDDLGRGLDRNAAALVHCLKAVPGEVRVLLETTAGTGTALGSRFEELAGFAVRKGQFRRIERSVRARPPTRISVRGTHRPSGPVLLREVMLAGWRAGGPKPRTTAKKRTSA